MREVPHTGLGKVLKKVLDTLPIGYSRVSKIIILSQAGYVLGISVNRTDR
jgi:hypothetical protein